jgi:hypothetical protein
MFGQNSKDTQEAFALTHKISELLDIDGTLTREQKYVPGRSQSSWVALSEIFFSGSYWSRVWIIQECVLARNVIVHSGKNSIN